MEARGRGRVVENMPVGEMVEAWWAGKDGI